MSPPTDSSTELNDAAYLLEVFAAMPEFKGDWDALAVKHGVHISTASRRFKAIAKRHGYKFENGKVTQDGEDAMAVSGSIETPNKAKAKRALKPKATPRKRKLSEATVKDEEDPMEAQSDAKAAAADGDKEANGCQNGSVEDLDEETRDLDEDYKGGAKRFKKEFGGEEIEETAGETA